jgi:hypothetical protein
VAALAIGQEMLAASTQDTIASANANRIVGHTLWVMGALKEARHHFDKTLDLVGAGRGSKNALSPAMGDDYVIALSGLARTLWLLEELCTISRDVPCSSAWPLAQRRPCSR